MKNLEFAFKIINKDITKTDLFRLLNSSVKDSILGTYKFIFYIRTIKRSYIDFGLGNRKLFFWCLEWWLKYDYESLILNLPIIPYYGSWKDLLFFFGTPLENNMLKVFANQLHHDLNLNYGTVPSLAAKYSPSENCSYDKKYNAASKLADLLNLSLKQYRKSLSLLRRQLPIIEYNICNKNFTGVYYTTIPKKALKLYGRIPIGPLYRYDKENYLDFIGNSTLQLHDSLYKSITTPSETNNIYDILMGFYNVKHVKYEQTNNTNFDESDDESDDGSDQMRFKLFKSDNESHNNRVVNKIIDHILKDKENKPKVYIQNVVERKDINNIINNIIDLNVNYPNYLNIINDTETFSLSNIEINDEPVIDPSKRQKKQLLKEIIEPIQSDIDDFVLI